MIIKQLGEQDYQSTWEAMRSFTHERDENTEDELWLLEHPPVFTQGQAGKAEHVLNPGDIPIVQTDRGGQVTYHGPGQLIGYCLFDIKRQGIGVKSLVCRIEQALIDVLVDFGITAKQQEGAPGLYVDGAKIASLGLRLRHARSYHGFSLNVDMDLAPFGRINPCGFVGMPVTQIKDFKPDIEMSAVIASIRQHFDAFELEIVE